ncbi:uncharacterized protein J4E78_000566 [Alternaria triticimaculans]|uniref:uncharacterized protein n=1 Tax=Alternaria triticimaculans TaxID=297637 RepID=UPI0020C2F6E2|nr:uncharacterized protein J4E78_000566 [Alternaria triticimaculans]KAI4672066.1 hypothetical protein J4E78_000566 [Alternaria triticimaculans]
MFMRLRGHTCKYCMGIDEQHYKRHHDIAERLRAVYESCGEIDWNIVPDESELEEHGIARDLGDEDTPSSKRERKDAKRLARAASRSRVITQEEIRYIDSVVHSVEGITSNDADGPRNPEEIEEIERQLRYHAHVYSTQVGRKGIRKLAEAPVESLNVDFEAEMDRILETFRINELLRRNTKTKGLQGKELKMFQGLVETFKHAVLEDIVLVKKDTAEVRMRRAGYLRYTSKTAYGIVEERYTGKDWKTGEKFASSLSDFSGGITPTDETAPLVSDQDDDQSPPRSSTLDISDRRHLESNHKRVSGDDGLYHADIEPYHTPLLPLPPAPTLNRQSAAVLVINVKASERGPTTVPGRIKKSQQALDGWQVVTNGLTPTKSVAKTRAWGNIPSKPPARAPRPGPTPWLSDSRDFPNLSASRSSSDEPYSPAPAVKPPKAWGMSAPESFTTETEDSVNGHPAISQKKKAKKAREAKRKAKKQSIPEAAISLPDLRNEATEDVYDVGDVLAQSAPMLPETILYNKDRDSSQDVLSYTESANDHDASTEVVSEPISTDATFAKGVSPVPLPEPLLPVTKHGKHMHWISTGPFNRLRGEKLLSLYEKDHRTKGRLMLVDDDLINYLIEDPAIRARNRNPDGIPDRLQKEYDDVKNGFNPGALMAQELRFERLYAKNGFNKQELTQVMLQDIQHNELERPGTERICYCRATAPKGGLLAKDTVVCSHRDCTTTYFHKSCVKKLGVEKVSRWYCTSCEQQMKILACQTLRGLGYTDIPTEHLCSSSYGLNAEDFEGMLDEKFRQMMSSPDMDYLTLLPSEIREKVKELGGLPSMPAQLQKQLKEKVRALGIKLAGADVDFPISDEMRRVL